MSRTASKSRRSFLKHLAAAGVASGEELGAKLRDPALLRSLGVAAPSLEGYLFPDTYKFRPRSSAGKVLGALVKRHQRVFEDFQQADSSNTRPYGGRNRPNPLRRACRKTGLSFEKVRKLCSP